MQTVRCSYTCKILFLVAFIIGLKLVTDHSRRDLVTLTGSTPESQPNTNLSEQEFLDIEFDPNQNFDIDEYAEMEEEVTEEMEDIINSLREQVRRETADYLLPSGKSISELTPEEGGTPMRSVVITTWRSGSTFIGGILNSHPATYHFSEPLTDFKTVQVRGEPLGTPAVRALRSLLTCRYSVLERYLERSKAYSWLFTHNTRVWQHCTPEHKDICFLPQFLTPVCQLFPFMSMKVVHIRLRLIEELLADPSLNLRVVYLVRDPRGVMHSRSTLGWCRKHPDCGDPVRVCADTVDDYSAALRFTKLFPDRFKVIRYEEMSLYPDEVLPDMFKFFGLKYHESVRRFVKIHTTKSTKNRYSTFRNSSATATIWRLTSNPRKVQELQRICRVAMDAWGYLPAHNYSHQLVFNPLQEPYRFP